MNENETYIAAKIKVLEIETELDTIRAEGRYADLRPACRRWGNASQKRNRAASKLLASLDRIALMKL